MNTRFLSLLVLACALGGSQLSAGGDPLKAPAADPHAEVRGVTVSCHRSGQAWGTPAMVSTLDAIKRTGGNWIAIHPYARIRGSGEVRHRLPAQGPAPAQLAKPIAWAHERGLKILIKPHLAYWGSRFSWRGEITFPEAEQRARFFRGYREWLLRLVALCKDADAICVGTELEGTTASDAEWRALIKEVRALAPKAVLTYGANWDRLERVGFWDALDAIGVQAYFPLVNHSKAPTEAELRAGWSSVMKGLRALSQKHRKPIVFSELGYDCSVQAAREPWKNTRGPSAEGRQVQALCLRVALEAIQQEPLVRGAFLWKTFPGLRVRREDFTVLHPELQPTIKKAWERTK